MAELRAMNIPYLTLIILSPALGLLLTLLVPSSRPKLARGVALASASVSLFISILLCFGYDTQAGGFQFIERHAWCPPLGIQYLLGIDGISLPMVLLTSLIFFAGVITMWELKERVKEFFALLLFLVLGVFGVFVSLDLFFFFLFYEIAILPMYLLILVWGSTKKEYAAMKLTLYLLLGSAFILTAFLAMAKVSGMGFDMIAMSQHTFGRHFQTICFLALYIGFGALAAVFPLHTWSPDGYAAAPTAASMLHAGVLKKLGAYGIIRVAVCLLPEGARDWAGLMAVLAAVNILYGGFCAIHQKDLKYLIGYLCISHMGVVLLGISTLSAAGLNAAVFQMFAHGLMTALFFSAVGYIYDRTHTRIIPDLGGLAKQIPLAGTLLALAALASVGLPGFAVFNAELMVFLSAFKTFPVPTLVGAGAIVITAFYVLRSLQYAIFGPLNPRWAGLKDATLFLASPRVLLVAGLILFGLFPNLLLELVASTSAKIFPVN